MARAPCSDEGEAERNEAADDKAGTNAAAGQREGGDGGEEARESPAEATTQFGFEEEEG